MPGFIRPSSWFKWLEKRQNLLKHMVYGKSSESDRQVPLGCKFSCSSSQPDQFSQQLHGSCRTVLLRWLVVACDLRLVDLIQEAPELREVLSSAGARKEQRISCDCCCSCGLHGSGDAGPNDVFLRLHGDEGPFFKKRNLLVLSLSFPHNHGDAFLHKLAAMDMPQHQISICFHCWRFAPEQNKDTIMTRLALCDLALHANIGRRC